MEKHMKTRKVYLFTFISFVFTFLFLYVFTEIAEQFYTGWDMFTTKNTFSMFADVIFIMLLLVNFIGVILCIIYPLRTLVGKFIRKN